jgi:hypothetical protein
MRRFYKNYIESNLFFWVFSLAALGLIVAGFLFPPPGQLDNSVLVGAGELNGTIALGCVLKAIDRGVDVTAQHNNTSISITNREEEEGDKKDKDEEEVG